MSCSRENCKICADSKFFDEFRSKLTDPEMKKQFDGLVDRMLCAEEEYSVEAMYYNGTLDLMVWYMVLDSFEAIEVEDAYESIKFLQEWRNDIRDNFGPAFHDHIWGPLPD